MNIGDNIKKYRKIAGITQVKLAKEINKSESTIRKYEANDVKPDFATLDNIAEALGCTLYDLTMNTDKLKNDVNLIESEKYIIELAEKNNIKINEEYDNDGDGEYLRHVYIKFENKEFRLSATEFHELSQRIIDSLITNIVAAENYNLIK